MKLVGGIPPTNPFLVARAYGVGGAVGPRAGVTAPAGPAVNAPAVDPDVAARVSRLVGAVVPGKVDFRGDEPAVGGAFTMYRRPAERNAAATGVELGRKIDVRG